MRKLKLDLADLHVESFHARGPEKGRGTVAGRMSQSVTLEDPTCGFLTCDVEVSTCLQTCQVYAGCWSVDLSCFTRAASCTL